MKQFFFFVILGMFLLTACSGGKEPITKLSDWDKLQGKTVAEIGEALGEVPVFEGPIWELPEKVSYAGQEFILTISFDEEGKMCGVRYRTGFQDDNYVEKATQIMDTLEEAIVSEFGEDWTYPGIESYADQEDPTVVFANGEGLRDDWMVDAENHVWANLAIMIDSKGKGAIITLSYGVNEDLTIPPSRGWEGVYDLS